MQNARRGLMVKLLKHCKLPDVYFADIPVWNAATQSLELVPLPFILPHEMFAVLLRTIDIFEVAELHRLSPELGRLKEAYCRELGVDPATFIGIGLHGDGVPHSKKNKLKYAVGI